MPSPTEMLYIRPYNTIPRKECVLRNANAEMNPIDTNMTVVNALRIPPIPHTHMHSRISPSDQMYSYTKKALFPFLVRSLVLASIRTACITTSTIRASSSAG